jgi:hypothetical protein
MTEAESVTRSGLRPAYAATRAHLGIVAVLFALAAIGWWWTVGEMRGMGNGRWTALGGGRVPHGTGNGAWSAGCCWALMASLFRAGRVSATWMAVVTGADCDGEDDRVGSRGDVRGHDRPGGARRHHARCPRRAARAHRSGPEPDALDVTDGVLIERRRLAAELSRQRLADRERT